MKYCQYILNNVVSHREERVSHFYIRNPENSFYIDLVDTFNMSKSKIGQLVKVASHQSTIDIGDLTGIQIRQEHFLVLSPTMQIYSLEFI